MPPAEPADRPGTGPDPDRPETRADPDPPGDEPPPVGGSDDVVEVEETRECWRCGLVQVPAASGRCRRCQARIAEPDEWSVRPRGRGPGGAGPTGPTGPTGPNPLPTVVVVFALMLLTSVVWGWVLLGSAHLSDEDVLAGTVVVEAVDTVLVLIALARVGRRPLPEPTPGARWRAWTVAVPVFGLLIVLNVLYGAVLKDWLKVADPPFRQRPLDAVVLLVACVQPALVEELFFRHVAFGVLRQSTGPHATVWISSVMFAGAHIYNPLGMPYLFVAGLVFGYLRSSGGLALPIVLHFCHNLGVLLLEGA